MSLQKLCLDSIAKGIEMYNLAYTSGDNEVLRRGFVILHKMYSDELLQRLITQRNLKEEYASLVFNKNLKAIDTEWFSSFSWETIVDIFTRIGPSLEKVIFNKYYQDGKCNDLLWEKVICNLPNVKAITYERCCNDDILWYITQYCPQVETLDVTDCYYVTNDGLKYFCEMIKGIKRDETGECLVQEKKAPCPLLKEIRLKGTSVKREGIEQLLKYVPSLEKIHCLSLPVILYRMHEDGIGSLYKTERLTHLDLSWPRCNPDTYDVLLKACVSLCPNLKSFVCPIYKLEHLSFFSLLRDVVDLELGFKCGEGTNAHEISDFLKEQGEKITSLTFDECTVSFYVLGQCCPRLSELSLNQVTIEYDEDESVPIFYSLKELTVNDVELSDNENCIGICQILKSSPNLEKLEFERCLPFPSEVDTEIVKCCEQCYIKYISFNYCDVPYELLIDILLSCPSLKILSVEGCNSHFQEGSNLCNIAETLPNKPKINLQ